MRKHIGVFIFFAAFFITLPSYSVKAIITPFRFNQYVYFEILHKVEGIPPTEFVNITVVEDTPTRLVFEYNGKQYKAQNLTRGAIYVDMPAGRQNRYLSRTYVPSLVLSRYDY